MCALHKNHWLWRLALSVAVLIASIHLIAVGLYLGLRDPARPSKPIELLGVWMAIPGFVGLFLWPVMAMVLKYTAIHETGIGKFSITLTGVSNEFVEAHRVYCQQERLEAQQAAGLATEAQEVKT
jgi:hypothetical protein